MTLPEKINPRTAATVLGSNCCSDHRSGETTGGTHHVARP